MQRAPKLPQHEARTRWVPLASLVLALSLVAGVCAYALPHSEQKPMEEALLWVRSSPKTLAEYDYSMTVRVRLLLFWISKADVGGGYIRRGVSGADPREEFFEVLFGSDPAKAPRAINRWGAGTEVAWHKDPLSGNRPADDTVASAFFGFMKSSRGKSVSEMQEELKHEREKGEHSFTGILSRVDGARALSVIVPLESDTDYTLHQYQAAEPLMLDRISASDRPVRSLPDGNRCPQANAFLASVAKLMDDAVRGRHDPVSRCYVHDAQENTLTLLKVTPVRDLPVQVPGPDNLATLDVSYRDVLQLDFVSEHRESGKKVYFTIFVGTTGTSAGIPLEIRYQPNWWFQVVLDYRPPAVPREAHSIAGRSF